MHSSNADRLPLTSDQDDLARFLEHCLACALAAARAAGACVLEVYAQDFDVRRKDDGSCVTLADQRSEALIVAALQRATPSVPVVSEESAAQGGAPAPSDRFWLVDPLDGTREFVRRNGEFTINIGLIEHGRPVLGVVFAPTRGQLYAARAGAPAFVEDDGGARREIACRRVPAEGLTVLSSRSHADPAALDAFLMGRRVAAMSCMGSALKLCLVARGEADLYPRLGPTMEWDTAGGHAILAAAGGRLTGLDGRELAYGKPGYRNPPFLAWGAGDGG